jgi:hypothetical protein
LLDARKTAEYAENFIKKHELIESPCANRAKSIPKNATIRKEYVNCKKPNCYRGAVHGPYYYAYWKEGKKIKKNTLVNIIMKDNYNKYKDNNKTPPLTPLPAIIIIIK